MSFKTFKEIKDLAKNRVNFLDPDDQVDLIINDAVNHAYIYDISKKMPTFDMAFVPIVNGTGVLPDNIHSIERISPAMVEGEYIKGNSIVSGRQAVIFEIIYTVVPDILIADTDEPKLPMKARYLLSTFACAEYFAYKKKLEVSQYYLSIYEREKASLHVKNNADREVTDTTGGW